jgi:predicted RNA binding protein YcfA (HicA-like mRNA interferase family)
MSKRKDNVVQLRPIAPFLLELHSERMVDVMLALQASGFKVTYVKGSNNRYRIDDDKRPLP